MITLYCENGQACVWNSEDWFELRTKHRISGVLVGSVPSYPRQNDFLGFPMCLMAEEAALLVDKGICELVEATNITAVPSDDDKKKIEESHQRLFEDQIKVLRENRIDQISQKIDLIVAGKKKKMMAKGLPITEQTLGRDMLLQQEIDKLPQQLNKTNYLVQISTQHPRPLDCKKLDATHLKGLDSVRYSVFKDLYEKGHYITNGSKFGGHFLVYPGDPIKFHASCIVRCLESENTKLRPTELVAFGRLAVAVNKRAVVATMCDDSVIYQTVQWHDILTD